MDEPVVGIVFGNVSTTDFRFAVRDPTLKRLDYVAVDHPTDGALVAHVTEVTRETNLSFDAAVSADTARSGLGGPRDATRAGYHDAPARDHLVARARVVGFRDARGMLQAPRTPVPAGAEVRRVDPPLLAHVFGLRDTDGAYLGVVKGYDLRVILDINTLVQKHVSILAKTGSGKSYAVGVLMEEMIKKGVPIVVIDPHGEHASLAQPNNSPGDQVARRRFGVTPRNYGEHIVEYSPDVTANPHAAPYALESVNLEPHAISDLLGGKLTNSQMGILHAVVRDLQVKEKDYALTEVLDAVREHPSNSKWNLVSAMESLVGLAVFSGKSSSVESLVVPKKVSIINLKGVSPDVQQMVVAITARRLFEARKLGKVPPFMLVCEEAHNFCPEKGMATTSSGEVMRTVASEGRKFGMGLMVVSQRPAKVDKNVLSQCNTQLILKVTNPNDLKALASSVEGFTSESEDEIQRLPVGVAFVSHPRISLPVLVEVRPRETSHGGESVDVMASVRGESPKPAAKAPPEDDEDEEDDGPDDDEDFAAPAPPPRREAPKRGPPVQVPVAAQRPEPRVAPPPSAPETRAPSWLEDLADEERFVAASDLDALSLDHLRALEADLAAKTQQLARADMGPRADALLKKLDAHLRRIHDIAEERERAGRGLLGRLLR